MDDFDDLEAKKAAKAKLAVERRAWYSQMQEGFLKHQHELDDKKRIEFHSEEKDARHNLKSKEIEAKKSPLRRNASLELNGETLVSLQNSPTANNLVVLFTPFGCSPSYFEPLCSLVRQRMSVNIVGVCLPGRLHRVRDKASIVMKDFVMQVKSDLLNSELISKNGNVKVALVGYCLGALIAYDLSRALLDDGYHISCLIAISAKSPLRQTKSNHIDDETRITYYNMKDKELLSFVSDLQGYNDSLKTRRETFRKMLPLIRQDLELLETYCIPPPVIGKGFDGLDFGSDSYTIDEILNMPPSVFKINIPIFTIHALNDFWISEDDLNAWELATSVTHENFVIEKGNHFHIHQIETQELLCTLLERVLS